MEVGLRRLRGRWIALAGKVFPKRCSINLPLLPGIEVAQLNLPRQGNPATSESA